MMVGVIDQNGCALIIKEQVSSLRQSMQTGKIKIRNGQRAAKRERVKDREAYVLTPPKYTYKNSTYNVFHKYEKKLGYDYDMGDSKGMKWMKQEFNQQMVRYLGGDGVVKKQGRKDKYTRQHSFKPEVNPLIRIFGRVNRLAEREMKHNGLEALRAA